jgi:hypothetical protein
VARFEAGQRRIDTIELLALCEIIGIDPHKAISKLLKVEGELGRPRRRVRGRMGGNVDNTGYGCRRCAR